jgi:hypothetical protein
MWTLALPSSSNLGAIDILAGICARASAVFFAILFATCLTTPQVAQAQGKAAVAQARTPAGSDWAQLHATQRQALQPLAAHWTQLSEGQKRKWIALSKNYANMTVDEQTKLRGRMTEWVALTPQQRSQARLNFAESKAATLSPGDKKAKWEAYQSLSPEQKRRLAAQVPPKTRGAAGVVKPVPAEKLSPPAHRAATAATAPAQPALSIDHNTAPSKHTAD